MGFQMEAESPPRWKHLTPRRFGSVRIIRLLLLVTFAALIAVSMGISKAEYSKKEGKACTFCHPPGKFKELTDAGKYYKEHNHSLEGYKAEEKK